MITHFSLWSRQGLDQNVLCGKFGIFKANKMINVIHESMSFSISTSWAGMSYLPSTATHIGLHRNHAFRVWCRQGRLVTNAYQLFSSASLPPLIALLWYWFLHMVSIDFTDVKKIIKWRKNNDWEPNEDSQRKACYTLASFYSFMSHFPSFLIAGVSLILSNNKHIKCVNVFLWCIRT